MDELTVRVERRAAVPAADADEAGGALAQRVKNRIGVTVHVDVLAPDTVERSIGQDAKRVVDERPAR